MTENEKRKKLYEGLKSKELYSKDYNNFESTFADHEKRRKLYDGLQQKGLFSQDYDTFSQGYFGDLDQPAAVEPKAGAVQAVAPAIAPAATVPAEQGGMMADIFGAGQLGNQPQVPMAPDPNAGRIGFGEIPQVLPELEKAYNPMEQMMAPFQPQEPLPGPVADQRPDPLEAKTPTSWVDIAKNAYERGMLQGELADQLHIGQEGGEINVGEIAYNQAQQKRFKSSAAYQKFSAAESVGDALSAVAEDPLAVITELGLESMVAMARHGRKRIPLSMGAGAAMGAPFAGIGAAPGAAAGFTAGMGLVGLNLEYSGKIMETLGEMGINTADAKDLKRAFTDEDLYEQLRNTGLKKGVPIALIDMLSLKLAGRILGKAPKGIKEKAMASITEMLEQTTMDAGGEMAGQLAADGKISAKDVLAEVLGGTGQQAAEVGVGALIEAKKAGKKLTSKDFQKAAIEPPKKEQEEEDLNTSVGVGDLKPSEAAEIKEKLEQARKVMEKIPSNFPKEAKLRAAELIEQREKVVAEIEQLEQSKESLDPAFHGKVDDKIAAAKELTSKSDEELAMLADEADIYEVEADGYFEKNAPKITNPIATIPDEIDAIFNKVGEGLYLTEQEMLEADTWARQSKKDVLKNGSLSVEEKRASLDILNGMIEDVETANKNYQETVAEIDKASKRTAEQVQAEIDELKADPVWKNHGQATYKNPAKDALRREKKKQLEALEEELRLINESDEKLPDTNEPSPEVPVVQPAPDAVPVPEVVEDVQVPEPPAPDESEDTPPAVKVEAGEILQDEQQAPEFVPEQWRREPLPKDDTEAKERIRYLVSNRQQTGIKKGITRKIGAVGSAIAKLFKDATGINIEGAVRTVDNSALNHIINNHEGLTKAEIERGQVPITEADLELIPEITNYPDQTAYQFEDGVHKLYSLKFIDGSYLLIEDVRSVKAGYEKVALKTMRKFRNKIDLEGQLKNRQERRPKSARKNRRRGGDTSDLITPEGSQVYTSEPVLALEPPTPASSTQSTEESSGNPNLEDDNTTPEQARAKGFRVRDGQRYDRQAPLAEEVIAKGAEQKLEFTNSVVESATYAVVEASTLQPSHRRGSPNPLHFLPEAQPKNRSATFDKVSIGAAKKIADNLDFSRVGQAPNPYSGAPVTNQRGEIIQGNNRTDGLLLYWRDNPNDTRGYKAAIVSNAQSLGLDPAKVEGMKAPVLVRMVNVSDARAIELGNYDAKDIESGGKRGMDPKAVTNKLNAAQMERLTGALLSSNAVESGGSMREAIREKGAFLIDALYKAGAINSTQVASALNSDGAIKPDAIDDISKVFRLAIFKGGDPNTPEMFEELPHNVREGVDRAILDLLQLSNEESLAQEVTVAVKGLYEYVNSPFFEVKDFRSWVAQADMFKGGTSPMETYRPLELKLVGLFANTKTIKGVAVPFRKYTQLVKGSPGDMFNPPAPGISKAEAVKKVFDVDGPGPEGNTRGEEKTPTGDSPTGAPGSPAAPGMAGPGGEVQNASLDDGGNDRRGDGEPGGGVADQLQEIHDSLETPPAELFTATTGLNPVIAGKVALQAGVKLMIKAVNAGRSLTRAITDAVRFIRTQLPTGIRLNIPAFQNLFTSVGSAPAPVVNQPLPAPAPQTGGVVLDAETWMDQLRTAIQDRFFRLKKLQKAATAAGISISDHINAYMKYELVRGKAKHKIDRVWQEVVQSKPGQKPSLFERMKKDGVSVEQLGDYLYALHAPERNAQMYKKQVEAMEQQAVKYEARLLIAKGMNQQAQADMAKMVPGSAKALADSQKVIDKYTDKLTELRAGQNPKFPLNPDGLSGMTNQEAADILADFDNQGLQTKLDAYAAEFRNKVVLPRQEALIDGGLMQAEDFDRMNDVYQHYVPLEIRTEDSGIRSGGGKDVSVRGKDVRRAKGSLEYGRIDRHNPAVAALTNYQSSVLRAEKNKADQAMLSLAKQIGTDEFVIHKPKYSPQFDAYGEVVGMGESLPDAIRDRSIQLKVNGKPVAIEVKDEALFRALKGLDVRHGWRWLQVLNSYLRGVNTIWNPEFLFTNFARDLQTAMGNVGMSGQKNMKRELAKNIIPAMKGIWQFKTGYGNSPWSETMREMSEHGGEISWLNIGDAEATGQDVGKAIELFEAKGGLKNLRYLARNFGAHYEAVSSMIEMASRLSAYKAAVDKGLSKEQAASLAKNLTVNFEKKGNLGMVIDSAYLFANAGIQGSAIMIKALATSKSARGVAMAYAASGFLSAMFNDRRDEEDDDYQKIHEGIRNRNLVFMKPDGTYYKLPLAYGYNVFKVIGEHMYFVSQGKETGWDAAKAMTLAAHDAFNPLASGSLIQAISPTGLDPLVQLAENKNWFGAPIMPEQKPFQPEVKESSLHFKSVRANSKAVTDWLNEFSGGSSVEAGRIDISPEALDHILDAMGGGLGKLMFNFADLFASDPETEKEWNSIPIIRNFRGSPAETRDLTVIFETSKRSATEKLTPREERMLDLAIDRAQRQGYLDEEQAAKHRQRIEENQMVLEMAQSSTEDPAFIRKVARKLSKDPELTMEEAMEKVELELEREQEEE